MLKLHVAQRSRPRQRVVVQSCFHDIDDVWVDHSKPLTFWAAVDELLDRAEYEIWQQGFGIDNSDRSCRIVDCATGAVVVAPQAVWSLFGASSRSAGARVSAGAKYCGA